MAGAWTGGQPAVWVRRKECDWHRGDGDGGSLGILEAGSVWTSPPGGRLMPEAAERSAESRAEGLPGRLDFWTVEDPEARGGPWGDRQ